MQIPVQLHLFTPFFHIPSSAFHPPHHFQLPLPHQCWFSCFEVRPWNLHFHQSWWGMGNCSVRNPNFCLQAQKMELIFKRLAIYSTLVFNMQLLTKPPKVAYCLEIPTWQLSCLNQRSKCFGRRQHMRQGYCVVISLFLPEVRPWGELLLQSCWACPGWLHLLLAFAFLFCDKRTKLPTEELPARSQ